MARNIEALITRCVSGLAPHDVLLEIEQELPSPKVIAAQLRQDLARMGVQMLASSVQATREDIRVCLSEDDDPSRVARLHTVIDTYKRIYPEMEFLVSSRS